MNKSEKQIAIAIVAIIGAVLIVSNLPSIQLPAITIPLPDGSSNTYPTPTPYNQAYPTAPPSSSEEIIVPTSLTVQMGATTYDMGDTVSGSVVSNGRRYPITIHAQHLASGIEQTFGGLINDYGNFYYSAPIDTAGYWDFWVTTDTVTSNKPRVTVQGILVVLPSNHWSHTFSNPYKVQIYSHSSGNAQIMAVNADMGIIQPLTTTTVNVNGYGEVLIDFDILTNGNWEVTALLNGMDAADYGGSSFLEVGR